VCVCRHAHASMHVCVWILHSMLCMNTNSMLHMGTAYFAVVYILHSLLCIDTLHLLNIMCTVPFHNVLCLFVCLE